MDDSPFIKENPKLQAFICECQKSSLAEIDTFTAEKWLNELLKSNLMSISANQFKEEYDVLIRGIHHEFNEKIFEAFKCEYLNGNDKTTTFNNICLKIGYKSVGKGRLTEWFEKFCTSEDKKNIQLEYQHLIKMMIEFYKAFECSFYFGRDCRFRCSFLDTNSRYKFSIDKKNDKTTLAIYDRYHEKNVNLYSTVPFEKIDNSHFLQNYKNHWLVLNENRDNVWTNALLLLFIDFEKKEFNLVHEQKISDGKVESVSFDKMDKHKFALKIYENNEEFKWFVVHGSVTNDRHIKIERPKIQITKEKWNYDNLCGGIFYGICKEEETLAYCSMDLNSEGTIQCVKEFDLNFDWPEIVDQRIMWKNHAWIEEKCYFQIQRDTCYLLNVETRKCIKLDFLSLGFPYGIKENDENLMLISDNALCVTPLRKPLGLEKIAFFSIRRYEMFFESQVYKKAIKQMPSTSEFQPFYDFKM